MHQEYTIHANSQDPFRLINVFFDQALFTIDINGQMDEQVTTTNFASIF